MGAEASRDKKADFTFIWRIENGLCLTFGKLLSSPIFTVKPIEDTNWSLKLQCMDSDVSLLLDREKEDQGPETIEIDFELSFLSADGIPIIKKTATNTFKRNCHGDFFVFAKKDEVFSRKREEFLVKDAPIVRCRMWRHGTSTPVPDVCFAFTSYSIRRFSILKKINELNSLRLKQDTIYLFKRTSAQLSQWNLDSCLEDCGDEEDADFDTYLDDINGIQGVIGEIALLDANGEVVHSEKISQCISLNQIDFTSAFMEIHKFLANETANLPNDVLFLRGKFEIFYGPTSSEIESCELIESSAEDMIDMIDMIETINSVDVDLPFRYDALRLLDDENDISLYTDDKSINKIIHEDNITKTSVEKATNSVIDKRIFEDVLYGFYTEKTLTDIVLQTSSESFPVHKIALCCRSAVFSGMVTEHLNRGTSNIIIIGEDADTLRRLLLYIYTNDVQEMQWKNAEDLFKAADKYELLDLKEKCSAILISEISMDNFCDALLFADTYNESELLEAVLRFISQKPDVLNSEEWELFRKENLELSLNMMERIIKNFRNSFN